MANIKSISHKKSSVIENGLPKLPTAAQLELGELAINFADGYETLSIKNSNNEIVTFTNDQYWKDKEQVIASALNDLNSRILAITVPTNVSDLINDVPYLTASDLDDTPTEDSDNGVTSGGVYDYITEIEEATSAALNDLNERIDDIVIPVVPTTSTTLVEDDPNPVSGGAVYDVIVENEQITSAALNDLNERIDDIPVYDSTNKLSADLIEDGTTNKVINVKPDWNAASGNAAEILNKPSNVVTGASTAYTIWCGTQAEYNALQTYDNNTVYLIKENA